MNIKNYIKKDCPRVYILFRNVYHSSSYYKNIIKKEELKKLENQRKRYQQNIKIVSDLFSGNYFVRYGPFKGMKYIKSSLGSQLLPKLLGSYEEPIQKWIEKAINKKYNKIINIGSAEGYYAVGFAYKLKNVMVYAYDIDPLAREKNRLLSKLNNVQDRVIIKSLCVYHDFEKLLTADSLIICDIEGEEGKLFNPEKAPKLRNTDMIIESHDFIIKNVTDLLIERFCETHKIELIVDYVRDKRKYPILLGKDSDYLNRILNEKRPKGMRWLRFTALKKIKN